jgi:UDP-galactopyranose mutase
VTRLDVSGRYDVLIVGAGFTGAVLAERIASQRGQRVLLIDRRSHIGGNAYDFRNERGILCHRYGPHIFHTNSQAVVDYLSQFTQWLPYEHRVVALVDGRLVPVPFNLTSLAVLLPEEAEGLANLLVATYGMDRKVPISKLLDDPDPRLRQLADFIYRKIFLGYTRKQWGLDPELLAPSVLARVPVHVSYDDRYFQDTFQQMPRDGYTAMFERMLSHPNIHVSLDSDYAEMAGSVSCDRVVHTGAIDEYFRYELGALPYRSLRFEFQTLRQARHQPVAQVNYPGGESFTRITEMGHLTQERNGETTVAVEYPEPHRPGETIAYYPIPRDDNNALHRRYVAHAAEKVPHIIFAGRLGDYRYYNMDQAVAAALTLFERQFAA